MQTLTPSTQNPFPVLPPKLLHFLHLTTKTFLSQPLATDFVINNSTLIHYHLPIRLSASIHDATITSLNLGIQQPNSSMLINIPLQILSLLLNPPLALVDPVKILVLLSPTQLLSNVNSQLFWIFQLASFLRLNPLSKLLNSLMMFHGLGDPVMVRRKAYLIHSLSPLLVFLSETKCRNS